ncbi:MAG: hypothetical protein GF388_02270 [Candidatus Aegiribacteria sp.]|nr:hypothetical protein [Candidatus Aegiribacteria sp.]MBD3294145.1 hypothetical protein [Candidatus Fermentibacteria bacterium]
MHPARIRCGLFSCPERNPVMRRICFFLAFSFLITSTSALSAQCDAGLEGEWEVRLLEMTQAALPGDTIVVPGDTVLMSKTLVLENLNDITIMFRPGSLVLLEDVYRDIVKLVGCSGVTVSGGSFRHVEPLGYYDCNGAVIFLQDCSDITVDNCRIMGCGAMGFRIWDSRNIRIEHCLIEDNSLSAVYLGSFNNLRINHCVIRNNGSLFYSTGQLEQANLRMENNLIHDNVDTYFELPPEPGLREEGGQ